MLLTIDVGNTNTVLGVHEGSELLNMWRVQTVASQTADEARLQLDGLLRLDGFDPAQLHGVSMATVVPSLKRLWTKVGRALCDCDVLAVDVDAVRGLLDVSAYGSTPGADRLADAVAASVLYGSPVVVIDMGTATNIEVIDAGARFLGGVIAPGIQTAIDGLVSRTALLPEVELTDPGCAIGGNTVSAIQIGIVYGQIDGLDGMVRRIWGQLGCETPVVATGGFGGMLGELSQTVTHVDPSLTLKGLQLIYDHVRG